MNTNTSVKYDHGRMLDISESEVKVFLSKEKKSNDVYIQKPGSVINSQVFGSLNNITQNFNPNTNTNTDQKNDQQIQ